mmetsp:Transcript_9951/g.22150  ORF Transcript_9951/g.22150 Transcript_9951/m.22150 type:complete len:276 (-) Transcript_9951:1434-2261(-)
MNGQLTSASALYTVSHIQGYLAHQKLPPAKSLQQACAQGPVVVLGGEVLYYERGIPELCTSLDGRDRGAQAALAALRAAIFERREERAVCVQPPRALVCAVFGACGERRLRLPDAAVRQHAHLVPHRERGVAAEIHVQVEERVNRRAVSAREVVERVVWPDCQHPPDIDGLAREEDVVGVLDVDVHLPHLQPVRVVQPRNLRELVLLPNRVAALRDAERHTHLRGVCTARAVALPARVRRPEAELVDAASEGVRRLPAEGRGHGLVRGTPLARDR